MMRFFDNVILFYKKNMIFLIAYICYAVCYAVSKIIYYYEWVKLVDSVTWPRPLPFHKIFHDEGNGHGK